MSNHTQKPFSDRDGNQTLRASFNDIDSSLTTSGFLTGKVGRKIDFAITTTTNPGDTLLVTYKEDGNNLYTFTIIYTDSTQSTLISAERTS